MLCKNLSKQLNRNARILDEETNILNTAVTVCNVTPSSSYSSSDTALNFASQHLNSIVYG